jgi:hypothetical protein
MLALVRTVMLRSASEKMLLRDGDGVLGTHRPGKVFQHGDCDPAMELTP